MPRPDVIYVLLLLAGLTVQLARAQNPAVQSAPLPVIQGRINGMDVVVQGESLAFFAGQIPAGDPGGSCFEALHFSLHRNHTPAIKISPEGIRLLQLNPGPGKLDGNPDNIAHSLTLNTVEKTGTASFTEFLISTETIKPTPVLATLYTGIPVVDQTPALAWMNNDTVRLLAGDGWEGQSLVHHISP